jgi:hypothetical protein
VCGEGGPSRAYGALLQPTPVLEVRPERDSVQIATDAVRWLVGRQLLAQTNYADRALNVLEGNILAFVGENRFRRSSRPKAGRRCGWPKRVGA